MPRSLLLLKYFCTDSSLVEDKLKDIPKEQLLFISFSRIQSLLRGLSTANAASVRMVPAFADTIFDPLICICCVGVYVCACRNDE